MLEAINYHFGLKMPMASFWCLYCQHMNIFHRGTIIALFLICNHNEPNHHNKSLEKINAEMRMQTSYLHHKVCHVFIMVQKKMC